MWIFYYECTVELRNYHVTEELGTHSQQKHRRNYNFITQSQIHIKKYIVLRHLHFRSTTFRK